MENISKENAVMLSYCDAAGIVVAAITVCNKIVRPFGNTSHLPSPFGEGRGTLLSPQEERRIDWGQPQSPACEA